MKMTCFIRAALKTKLYYDLQTDGAKKDLKNQGQEAYDAGKQYAAWDNNAHGGAQVHMETVMPPFGSRLIFVARVE